MTSLKKVLTAFIIFVFPSRIAIYLLRTLGHSIHSDCRFGFSIIFVDKLFISNGVRIGHLNVIWIRRLILKNNALIGRSNLIAGPISINLNEKSAIGNANKIVRGPVNSVVTGGSQLKLGILTKITSNHRLDCTKSIYFGDYSILAGITSQIWTHGYVHDLKGPGRYRVDGKVVIGSNVYLGSSCIINGGVSICDGVTLGAGATVARSLVEEGLYVSSALRKLPRPKDPDDRSDLRKSADQSLCERVYIKQNR